MDGRALFMGTPIFYEGVFIYMRTYYETLGVSADAKTDEIRKNYRRLVKENHPDLHPGDKAAEERFKEIAEAWETLGDEEKRKKYDAEIAKVKKGEKPWYAAAHSAPTGGKVDIGAMMEQFSKMFTPEGVASQSERTKAGSAPIDTDELFFRFMGLKK